MTLSYTSGTRENCVSASSNLFYIFYFRKEISFKLYFQLVVMRALRKLNVLLVLVLSAAFRQKLNKWL